MYSVVLLMALGGGGEAPALGHHDGCSGCTGYATCCGCCGGYVVTCGGCSGCSGCCGGCSGCSGCCGGYVVTCGGCSGCSGCCGGCSGWATHSSCTGCCGGCHGSKHHFFGKHRHGHDSCHGCCCGCHGTVISYDTCGGCSGCGGGTVVVPAAPPVMEAPKKEVAPMPKGKPEEVRTPATPANGATFVSEPAGAFEASPAAPTEPRSLGNRIWGRLRGPSAP